MKKTTFFFGFASALLFSLSLLSFSACKDPNAPKSREEQIEEIVEKIKVTPEWLTQVKAKAEQNKQPLDSVMRNEAIFLVDKDVKKALPREQRIKDIVAKINGTPDWLAQMKKQAEEQKKPLDTIVLNNANWLIDEEDGKHAPQPAPQPAPQQK